MSLVAINSDRYPTLSRKGQDNRSRYIKLFVGNQSVYVEGGEGGGGGGKLMQTAYKKIATIIVCIQDRVAHTSGRRLGECLPHDNELVPFIIMDLASVVCSKLL